MKKLLPILLLLFSIATFAQNYDDSLYMATVGGDVGLMKNYISKGANVNYVKQQGWVKVSLLITAVNKKNVEAVKLLIEHGADVNWKDGFNTTALMYASNNGDVPIVEFLLEHGADIEHKDAQGNDAISAAKEGKHEEVVKILEAARKKKK